MLKEKRKEAGLRQRELAEKADVPYRTLQHWEEGHVLKAAVGQLKRVADVLGCKVDDLL